LPGALAGLRIVDLTSVLMGPYATQLLADMGADVIKVESAAGDSVRGIGPMRNAGMGPIFLQANRGKRSIVLDLKREQGRDVLARLLARADALIFNIRPRAMARLGLSYGEVERLNPGIIYAGLFGYGEDGPYAGRAAYDDLVQGEVGLPGLYTLACGGEPRYTPLALADRIVGLFGVHAVLGALWSRTRTGSGQSVEVPMFETMAHFVLGDHLGGHLHEEPSGSMGYPRLLSKDRRPYPTRDGHVCAVIYNDGHWRRFFQVLHMESILEQDPRFASITSRTRHIDEIYAMVASILGERTTAECVALLNSADIPVAPLQTIDRLLHDPHLLAKGFFEAVEHPSEGRLRMPANPIRFSRTPARVDRPAPLLGEHSCEILAELGYDRPCIDRLLAEGVTTGQPTRTAPNAPHQGEV